MNHKPNVAGFFIFVVLLAAVDTSVAGESQQPQKKIARIYELEANCVNDHADVRPLSGSCLQILTEYFDKEPIWNSATVAIEQHGKGRIHTLLFNLRQLNLRYSSADYAIGEVPRWRDIFDDQIDNRVGLVRRVMRDQSCKILKSNGRIRPSYAEQCQARELFKYAMFLESCVSGFDRYSWFHHLIGPDRLPLYEEALISLERSPNVDKYFDNAWQLREKYLQSMWVSEICASKYFPRIGDMKHLIGENEFEKQVGELRSALQTTHDNAMAISARSGDAWAIQSFYVSSLYSDLEYWESLSDLNPLLFHRWMARKGYSWLGEKGQGLNALKAYSIEQELLPTLNLDEYLYDYDLKKEDILDPPSITESNLEEIDWDAVLKYPWNIED